MGKGLWTIDQTDFAAEELIGVITVDFPDILARKLDFFVDRSAFPH